ncbi:MAG: biotin/lipoyl-containing protein, partial [Bacteroidota bacterium]
MATIELKLPKMGESVAEASILNWLKKEGDRVTADEPIIEIATDKVNSEVPSPEDGILVSCKVNVGDTVQVGHVIAIIQTEGGEEAPKAINEPSAVIQNKEIETPKVEVVSSEVVENIASSDSRFYSPLVKTIAKKEGITQAQLDGISGTGQNGRVTKEDLLKFISSVAANQSTQTKSAETSATVSRAEPQRVKGATVSIGGNDEVIEMDRMRKLIADHMVMSKQVSPHVTSYVEADVTNIVMWREKVKKTFEQNYKTKLTFTPIFIEAVAK